MRERERETETETCTHTHTHKVAVQSDVIRKHATDEKQHKTASSMFLFCLLCPCLVQKTFVFHKHYLRVTHGMTKIYTCIMTKMYYEDERCGSHQSLPVGHT